MRKILFFFIFSSITIAFYGQDSTNGKAAQRYKGLQLVYVNLTGNVVVIVGNSTDNQFLLEMIPTYAYYFSKKVEGVLKYHFSYLKYPAQSPLRNDIFNQFSVGLHYYPLKKLNSLYTEIGFTYGNYFLEKRTLVVKKNWDMASQIGFGFELLAKRGLTLNFNAAFMIPFNPRYDRDFIRSIGIGIQLRKKDMLKPSLFVPK